MKFKLIESMEDIQINHDINEDKLEEITSFFLNKDFKQADKLNGIAFEKELSSDNNSLFAQFYIDTTKFTYSCYITSNINTNEITYSAKGDFTDVDSAIERFISELEEI